jgi:hypothetical protein
MSYWEYDGDITESKIKQLQDDLRFYRTEHRTMSIVAQSYREALLRVKNEAVSLADAQVIALEATK